MVQEGLARGNHGDQDVRAVPVRGIRGQRYQDWKVRVCKHLARIDESMPFRFEPASVLPGVNQPRGGGKQQFKTRMKVNVAEGDPGGSGWQGNDLIRRGGEARRALRIG